MPKWRKQQYISMPHRGRYRARSRGKVSANAIDILLIQNWFLKYLTESMIIRCEYRKLERTSSSTVQLALNAANLQRAGWSTILRKIAKVKEVEGVEHSLLRCSSVDREGEVGEANG